MDGWMWLALGVLLLAVALCAFDWGYQAGAQHARRAWAREYTREWLKRLDLVLRRERCSAHPDAPAVAFRGKAKPSFCSACGRDVRVGTIRHQSLEDAITLHLQAELSLRSKKHEGCCRFALVRLRHDYDLALSETRVWLSSEDVEHGRG